jgi:hypothetical protein
MSCLHHGRKAFFLRNLLPSLPLTLWRDLFFHACNARLRIRADIPASGTSSCGTRTIRRRIRSDAQAQSAQKNGQFGGTVVTSASLNLARQLSITVAGGSAFVATLPAVSVTTFVRPYRQMTKLLSRRRVATHTVATPIFTCRLLTTILAIQLVIPSGSVSRSLAAAKRLCPVRAYKGAAMGERLECSREPNELGQFLVPAFPRHACIV